MKPTAFAVFTLAAIGAGPALAATGVPSLPTAGAFSITPDVGTVANVGGTFVNSGSRSYSGTTTLFGGPASPPITVVGTAIVTVPARSFGDVYRTPFQLGASVSYGLTDRDEISGRFRWLHADAQTFDAMTISAAATLSGHSLAAGTTLQGKFNNYDEEGLELGYRHFFDGPWRGFHPYLGALIGGKYNSAVTLDLLHENATIVSGIHFYGSGISLSTGLTAGFRYDVAADVALGLETDIRYEGLLNRDNTTLAGSGGLSDVNNGGDRWDIPVVAGATVKF